MTFALAGVLQMVGVGVGSSNGRALGASTPHDLILRPILAFGALAVVFGVACNAVLASGRGVPAEPPRMEEVAEAAPAAPTQRVGVRRRGSLA